MEVDGDEVAGDWCGWIGVRDPRTGIPPDILELVFERF